MRLPCALLLVALGAGLAQAQMAPRDPSTGYLFPAGGQQGTVVEVMVGGQGLVGARVAYVSGQGVSARVVQYLRPLSRDQQRELQRRLLQLARQREGGRQLGVAGRAQPRPRLPAPAQPPTAPGTLPPATAPAAAAPAKEPASTEPVTLPDHPLLRDLEQKSLPELREVAERLLRLRSRQQTPAAIAENVVLEVTIAPDAPPGDRELRLLTARGLTNPMRFQVGTAPEVREHEPNNPDGPPPGAVELPVVVNGDIMPGDVDRFAFQARQGQKLVIAASARSLMPYLADAVPGWFQAVLVLYDAQGKVVAINDDYRFQPDPVIFYQVPADGDYVLELRDAIYRGREDFVYRISIGEQPFITSLFPLGGRSGAPLTGTISGWNLPQRQVRLDTQPGGDCIRQAAWRGQGGLANPVHYAVDDLPELNEQEPNNDPARAQPVTLPVMVNGRIQQAGDGDIFRFEGRAGQEVVAEVYARRLDSPLDSLLRLTDATGQVVAWNDDHERKEMGLMTHHADSYLSVRLPRDGTYLVQVADTQRQGGEEYGYRLRIGPPRPDFALVATPAGLLVRPGPAALLQVYAFRKDGFDGEIEVVLQDAPAGCTLSGGRIPQGRSSVQMTVSITRQARAGAAPVWLEGRAQVGGETVARPVLPAHNMMQAFAYWHLVPAQELLVVTGDGRAGGMVELADPAPVRIPAGGTAQVQFRMARVAGLAQIRLELHEPPPGITLGEMSTMPGGVGLELKSDGKGVPAGYADNLVVEAFTEVAGPSQEGKPQPTRRFSVGFLPAIPFEIVQP